MTLHHRFPRVTLAFLVGGALFVAGTFVSCGQRTGGISGSMFVPPGLSGTAQWGEIWLVRDYRGLEKDLDDRQRLLVFSLLGNDAQFLRNQRKNMLELTAIEKKLDALDHGRVPTRIVLPAERPITAITPVDSVIAGVRVISHPATTREIASVVDNMKSQLKAEAVDIRNRMDPAIASLRKLRLDQKRTLLSLADNDAAKQRVTQAPAGMDGRFHIDDVATGEYGLYARYRLLDWFVLTPITVTTGIVSQEIPRLPGVILDSQAVVTVEAMCSQIAQM